MNTTDITATDVALDTVRNRTLRSEPTSTTLVLYALAAVLDDQGSSRNTAWLHDVARAAGLSESTTRGHLNRLQAKGVVVNAAGLWRLP